jgi:alpha-L-rhamnosidase
MLDEHYEFMKRCLAGYRSWYQLKEGEYFFRGIGDWLDVRGEREPPLNPDNHCVWNTSEELTGAIMYFDSARTMQKVARVLGEDGEAREFAELAERIRAAALDRFYDRENHTFGSQAGDAMALFYELAPPGEREAISDSLERHVRGFDGHLATGFYGTPPLLLELSRYGKDETAYELMMKTDFPGYGDLLRQGLTAMIEGWRDIYEENGWKMGRLQMENCGGIEWFYRGLGGIEPNESFPGFERFRLRPACVEQLQYAKVTWKSPRGLIRSAWRKTPSEFVWDIEVPTGSRANICLPSGWRGAVRINGRQPDDIPGAVALPGHRTPSAFDLPAGRYRVAVARNGA